MKRVIRFILIGFLLCWGANSFGQENYYKLYTHNPYVEENQFIETKPDLSTPPVFETIKSNLPSPSWSVRKDVIAAYWKAWEIAFSNLRAVNPASGFTAPYIDAAFNGCVFMWDTSFMSLFGKYGTHAFNFQGSLDNFYAKQKPDGFICREIRSTDGSDCFERFEVSSTGPNIMPWSEWEYFENFNDTLRLKKIFSPLLAYYKWVQINRTWKGGSYNSSGWGCGMDNQPRVPEGYDVQWGNAHMSWIDTNMQQIMSAKILIKMAKKLHREKDVEALEKEVNSLTDFVNSRMWNDKISFYTDLFEDNRLSSTMTIGSYWSLLADVVPPARLERYLSHLTNAKEFNREHRVPSLSASDLQYDPNGGYWKGSVWAPTEYMVLRGLTAIHRDSLAYEIAYNHLNNVVGVFSKTGTFFENYAPEKVQGNDRKNFVGWTGLSPIAVLMEYVFGIRADVPNNRIVWDVRLKDDFGVDNYPFGKEGCVSLHSKARKDARQRPKIKVNSNVDFTLALKWDGGQQDIAIKASVK